MIVSLRNSQNLVLESRALSTLNSGYVNSSLTTEQEAEAFTLTAMLSVSRDASNLSSFQDNAVCLNRSEIVLKTWPKYRAFDGFGNNLKHPYWGAAEMPFGRFGPKTFADGIYTLRKSDRTLKNLPNPREIVEKVLKPAKKTPRNSNFPNTMLVSFIVYVPTDIGHSNPVETSNKTRIQCCSSGNKNPLPQSVRHSSCIPISVPKDDWFYKSSNVGCLSHVRSELASAPSDVQFGEKNISRSN